MSHARGKEGVRWTELTFLSRSFSSMYFLAASLALSACFLKASLEANSVALGDESHQASKQAVIVDKMKGEGKKRLK